MRIENKLEARKTRLIEIINRYKSAIVAFSGGVDSTLLAYLVHEQLQDRMLAITIKAPIIPSREINEAVHLAKRYSIPHRILDADDLALNEFIKNDRYRCYHCKKHIFSELLEFARSEKYEVVFDGSNADDSDDFRPGSKALEELGIVSPLKESGLTKDEIRILSANNSLPTADKPSYACLASRIPYGTPITSEALKRIEAAEEFLFSLGFEGHRVRDHFPLARIEVREQHFKLIYEEEIRRKLIRHLNNLGYKYITLDLEGYRTGSLNI